MPSRPRVDPPEPPPESLTPAPHGDARLVVYEPGSALRRPRELVAGMARDLGRSRELAWRLFVRNTSARYRQTALGWIWALAPPLVSTAVFVFLRRAGVFAAGEGSVPYAAFLLTGVVLWQTFVDALGAPLRLVNHSRDLLARINFPREALVLAGLAEVLFNFLVRALLLVAALAVFHVRLGPATLLFPVGLATLVGVGLALGLALVPLGVLYQDVEQGLGVVTALWFFVTPVVYPAPAGGPGALTATLNPAGAALDTARAWLLGATPAHLDVFAWVAGGAFLLLIAAWLLYRLALPILIERMSA